jgi:hypothetical protein
MVVTDISNPYAAPTEESSQWSLIMKDLKMRSSPEQASGREYDVGYRKPPTHKQFKLGQSGNPRGRPKGSKNESTILHGILHRKIKIQDGGRSRQVTILEAMLTRFAQDSLKGNVKSAAFLLNRYGTLVSGEIEQSGLNSDDRAVLEAFMTRLKATPSEGDVP